MFKHDDLAERVTLFPPVERKLLLSARLECEQLPFKAWGSLGECCSKLGYLAYRDGLVSEREKLREPVFGACSGARLGG